MNKTIQTPAFQNLIDNYDGFIKVKNYKVGKSKKLYHNPIKEFLIWLEETGIPNIKNVTSKESIKYFDHLITRPRHRSAGTLSEKTIKFHLFSLGLFLMNLLENKEIENGFFIPCYSDGSHKARNSLTVEEVKTIYQYCVNHQERALLSIGYGCGLRNAEIEALDINDIQFSTGMLIVRKGKNGKRRDVPMSNTVIEYLKKYITEERHQMLTGSKTIQGALFITPRGKRMNGEQMNNMLKKMSEQTNQYELIRKGITLHCLRHSIACHLAQNNAGIEFIRCFLGHAQINTTYIYAIKNKKIKPTITF